MAKTGPSKSAKVEKSSSSNSSADDSQQSEDIVWEDIDEVTIKEEPSDECDDPVFDSYVSRTFIVTHLGDPDLKTSRTKVGGKKSDVVVNNYTINTLGLGRARAAAKRILHVSKQNLYFSYRIDFVTLLDSFARANIGVLTVFRLRNEIDFVSVGHENLMSTNDSKFLQVPSSFCIITFTMSYVLEISS